MILREDGGAENTCSTDDGKPEWIILASCFFVQKLHIFYYVVNSYGKNYKLVIIFLKFVDEVTCWTYTEVSVEYC